MTTKRSKLDNFTRSYMETALWSSNDESNEQGGEPLDKTKALLAARAKLAAVGMAIKKTDNEYRVYPKGNRDPNIGYFTDDLDDAVATGLHMAGPQLPPGSHIVMRDFSTLPEVIAHAQQEGATHVLLSGRHTMIFFPTTNGRYEEARVWREAGYWHAEAQNKRSIVDQLPKGAEPIENQQGQQVVADGIVRDYIAVDPGGRVVGGPFKNYDSAKRSADEAGGYVQYTMNESVMNAARPRGTPQRRVGSSARFRLPSSGARESSTVQARRNQSPKKAGAKYAQDQLGGDYFMDWVRDQMAEAEEMRRRDPFSVMSLQTRNDYEKLARNMLQQLEWDTKREPPSEAFDSGNSREFFEGFVEELKANTTVSWLADELGSIHEESRGSMVEASRAPKAFFGEAERNGYAIKNRRDRE